jgi:hypothetical protein
LGTLENLKEFFRRLLIARQLSDDAHDWEADLRGGRLNAVAVALLRRQALKQGLSELHGDLDGLLRELSTLFWHEGVTELDKDISRQLAEARRALAACGFLERPEELDRLLLPVERSMKTIRSERAKTLAFLAGYGQGSSA